MLKVELLLTGLALVMCVVIILKSTFPAAVKVITDQGLFGLGKVHGGS